MPINPDAVGAEGSPSTFSWDSTSSILYALGVGAGMTDPTETAPARPEARNPRGFADRRGRDLIAERRIVRQVPAPRILAASSISDETSSSAAVVKMKM